MNSNKKMEKLPLKKLHSVKAGVTIEVCEKCKWFNSGNPKACAACGVF